MWLENARCGWAAFMARHAWARWVQKWGVSAGSLAFGLVTLLVFRRGIEYFPWFVGYLLFLWLAGVVFAETRRELAARGPKLLWRALDYTVQTLVHGLLLFLLPIYYGSTTLTSANVGFLLFLAVAAFLTSVDPWYRAILTRYRRVEILLFGFCLFASLNVAFPLVGVQTTWALPLTGIFGLSALTPVLHRGPKRSWPGALLRAGLWGVVAGLLLWLLRGYIPPVPMQLTRGTFARSVSLLEPQETVTSLPVGEARAWGGLTAFTAIAAPAGLREPIYHVWRKDGTIVARVPLALMGVERPSGFRTYSRKTGLGLNPVGSWTVDVLTTYGQLIGRVRLIVTP
jgi:hypothetical protein